MSDGTPPPPPPPSDSPYGAGGAAPPPPPSENPYGAGGAAPPPPFNQPTPGAGGYGAPPPPPPPVPGSGRYSPTEAFSYGWAKFKSKPGELLVPILVVLLVIIVLEVIVQVLLRATLLGTHDCTRTVLGTTVQSKCGPGLLINLLGTAVGGFIVSLIAQMLGAGLIKNALHITDGQPASLSEIGTWATKPQVVTAALIVAAATSIGTILCYVPGIIAAFLLNWTMFYVVDEDMAPVDAAKASISFVTSHLGDTLVFYLLGIVAFVVGAILCLVGLLVAAPVVLIGAAYTFRVLNGRQVSPVAA